MNARVKLLQSLRSTQELQCTLRYHQVQYDIDEAFSFHIGCYRSTWLHTRLEFSDVNHNKKS